MNLIKTSFWNGLAVIIKAITGFALNKILAIYVGPAGYAILGQFQNAIQMLTTFASGAIRTGVIKYTSEFYDDESRQHGLWRTAGAITLYGSLIVAIFIAVFSEKLAVWFLKDKNYYDVFLWLAGTITLLTFNALMIAILNGKKEIKWYVFVNIIGSIVTLGICVCLSIYLGVRGALISLCVNQSIMFFVTLSVILRRKWFKIEYLFGKVDKLIAIKLSKFVLMALTSAACAPLAQIAIRTHLSSSLGLDVAGYWEAMIRLSLSYLTIITMTLSVYFLPRLSEIKEPKEIKKEIFQGYLLIIPLCLILSIFIYFLRVNIIEILFTTDFLPMSELFFWQLIGDVLKIGSWLLSFLMLAKGLTKMYILTEVCFSSSRVLLSILFIEIMGVKGATFAYALNYAVYWLVLYYLFFRRKKLEKL